MPNPNRIVVDCSDRRVTESLLSNAETAELTTYQNAEAARAAAEQQRATQITQARQRIAANPAMRDVAIALGIDVPAGP